MHISDFPQFLKKTKYCRSNDAMSAWEKMGPNFHANDHVPILYNSANISNNKYFYLVQSFLTWSCQLQLRYTNKIGPQRQLSLHYASSRPYVYQ